ncbi:probable dolichyl pyrophosphate Glc1Man9GlcNAc2 alpha-1,3-glucosyltransferase [Diachasma alloeum]|uniref:probable dolichyl pyrophosphate Glc1Man9GlcNAc2 alpha-1,3-glucosyltransferase n=1 Tax=Diachasma alloeum TaxID=454923 RepID=UPI0007384F5B|nr:probable dolichyl pyrophosphate Glc1Man9GlcNAc2 alpha-1,3-glucosyltransferase [Diachasma alloeum]
MSPRAHKQESHMKESQKVCREANTQWSRDKLLLQTFALVSSIKVLLVPTYHSTDFEVHRNWLAITHSLPINEWYTNSESEWTLDYPPLFAWFEWLLSQFGKLVDPEMLKVDNLNYASGRTVLFQRATVMISDLALVYGVREMGKVYSTSFNSFAAFSFLTLCNMGLLVVDHIHFQYNGFLLGILLIAIANVSKQDQMSTLVGAGAFAVLLNLKHLYLYVAPPFIVWLLKWYCLRSGHFFLRLIQLGGIVLTVLAVSFGPFMTQLPEVLSRLFPFKRGLVHAYWAPNAWALYIGADKMLSLVWKRLGLPTTTKTAAMTGGLVQEGELSVLPTPTPLVAFIATFLAILPALIILFKRKQNLLKPRDFVECLVLCGLSSFIFGWHVHEKAILTAIVPLCVLATLDSFNARVFMILSAAGHTSILPLLFPKNLTILKITMLLTYSAASCVCLPKLHRTSLLKIHEWLYVAVLPLVTLYETLIHRIVFGEKLPFLPLAGTSVYCAIGVLYSWLLYYHNYSCGQMKETKTMKKKKR